MRRTAARSCVAANCRKTTQYICTLKAKNQRPKLVEGDIIIFVRRHLFMTSTTKSIFPRPRPRAPTRVPVRLTCPCGRPHAKDIQYTQLN